MQWTIDDKGVLRITLTAEEAKDRKRNVDALVRIAKATPGRDHTGDPVVTVEK